MKNIKKITALIGLATLSIATANAGVYIGADAGYSRIHIGKGNWTEINDDGTSTSEVTRSKNKNKDLESIKLGYSFNNGLRTEIALTRYGSIKSNGEEIINETHGVTLPTVGYLKSKSLMINAYYDFNTTSPLQPYVMAGIGLGINKTGIEVPLNIAGMKGKMDYSNKKNAVAYQVGAGASYKITNQWYADAGIKYAYLGTSSLNHDMSGSYKAKVSSVDATIGIRYAF